mmetsp:Transcript_48332/g.54786  ORF Transcript_48332/g.54786 Transcript_48332/m.54786 type:complete len:302 (-) Transcript_48332:494-1399(-)
MLSINWRSNRARKLSVIAVIVLITLVDSISSLLLVPLQLQKRTTIFSCTTSGIDNQDKFENDDDDNKDEINSNASSNFLDMNEFQRRKRKILFHNRKQQWHQPPNSLLEDPIHFILAMLKTLQLQRCNSGGGGGTSCLLQASTPSWRRVLFNSVGVTTNATDAEVAFTLQNALERPTNQFAILVNGIDEDEVNDNDNDTDNDSRATSISSSCWDFPADPVQFQEYDDEKNETIDFCWIESRLRSPKDDNLLAVVGWSLTKTSSSIDSDLNSFWLLDGIDWQDFRDDFRPGIGREEWERICG